MHQAFLRLLYVNIVLLIFLAAAARPPKTPVGFSEEEWISWVSGNRYVDATAAAYLPTEARPPISFLVSRPRRSRAERVVMRLSSGGPMASCVHSGYVIGRDDETRAKATQIGPSVRTGRDMSISFLEFLK